MAPPLILGQQWWEIGWKWGRSYGYSWHWSWWFENKAYFFLIPNLSVEVLQIGLFSTILEGFMELLLPVLKSLIFDVAKNFWGQHLMQQWRTILTVNNMEAPFKWGHWSRTPTPTRHKLRYHCQMTWGSSSASSGFYFSPAATALVSCTHFVIFTLTLIPQSCQPWHYISTCTHDKNPSGWT